MRCYSTNIERFHSTNLCSTVGLYCVLIFINLQKNIIKIVKKIEILNLERKQSSRLTKRSGYT